MSKANIFAVALIGGLAVAASPASAIECEGNFQIQRSGDLIATPYCEDNYLAEVAEEYGAEVSAARIRENPSYKSRICRIVGYDNRVRSTCAPYRNERGRNRFLPF